MEQKVIPQNIRGLGNICDNFNEDDFTKVNSDTTLQDDVAVNNVNLRCFRLHMKGTDITISVSGSSSLTYNQPTTYNVTVNTTTGLAVSGVTVGLYVNDVLVASSGNTGSAGGCTITYTPQVFGNVTLEFKVLPQDSYAMAKTTKNVTINIGTKIIVYSPYISQNNKNLPAFAVWVVTEDSTTIVNSHVLMVNGDSSLNVDTNSTSDLDVVYIYDNIAMNTSLSFNFSGSGYYGSSSVTKVAGSDGPIATATPPTITGGS